MKNVLFTNLHLTSIYNEYWNAQHGTEAFFDAHGQRLQLFGEHPDLHGCDMDAPEVIGIELQKITPTAFSLNNEERIVIYPIKRQDLS